MRAGLILTILLGFATAAAPQPTPPQLVIAGVTPDPAAQTLTIAGRHFGPHPLVTLDLVPLPIQSAVDTKIVAVAPLHLIPSGAYLLTVSSRGPSPAEHASFVVTLGGAAAAPGSTPGDTSRQPVASAPQPAVPDAPAAKVGDRVMTIADIDREWQRTDPASYLRVYRQLHQMRRQIADAMVANEVLAREASARGITTDALLAKEIPSRIVAMPDSAVLALYQSLGDQTRGATLDEMRPALRAWMERNTEREIAKRNYVEELMKVSTRAEIFLAPPRVDVERARQDAALGPASAPVEIVAFGDFGSPRYATFARALGSVRETFGDRVRVVFKNLPVLGPESVTAAEAAQCAHAHGKFWAYHDKLVAEDGVLVRDRLKQVAVDIGLDGELFDACFDAGQFREVVRDAIDEARRYDISDSPSFLVNGQLAPDPPPFLPPFEFFTRVVEEELLFQARNSSPKRR